MKRSLLSIFLALFVALACAADSRKTIVPPFEMLKTKNGVDVYYFRSEKIPIFQVELDFEGGTDFDPEGKSGLGVLTASMLKRGIPGMDEDAISRKIDDLAGGVEFSIDGERANAVSYGLNEHADEILKIFFASLSQAAFPEGPFTRTKTNHLDAIAQISDSPAALASYAFDLMLFNGTAKARPTAGFRRDLRAITLEDVRGYYPKLFRTDHLRALVIGGRDRRVVADKVVSAIEKLGCLECGKPEEKTKVFDFRDFRAPRDAAVLIDRKGITEAHVHMGFVGPKRQVPEFYDLRVAETILSGYFGSRMNLVLREKLNLTYNIAAGYTFGEKIGAFEATTSTRNEKIGELLSETQKILREFGTGEVTEKELQDAKDYLTGSFPLGLQNLYVIAGSFFHGMLGGLEPEFLDVYSDRIRAVTRESVKAAIQKHFRLEQLITVIAGDEKHLHGPLERAGLRYLTRPSTLYLK